MIKQSKQTEPTTEGESTEDKSVFFFPKTPLFSFIPFTFYLNLLLTIIHRKIDPVHSCQGNFVVEGDPLHPGRPWRNGNECRREDGHYTKTSTGPTRKSR